MRVLIDCCACGSTVLSSLLYGFISLAGEWVYTDRHSIILCVWTTESTRTMGGRREDHARCGWRLRERLRVGDDRDVVFVVRVCERETETLSAELSALCADSRVCARVCVCVNHTNKCDAHKNL